MTNDKKAEIDDTYAEAFRSLMAEILITARDRRWLDEAIRAVERQTLTSNPLWD